MSSYRNIDALRDWGHIKDYVRMQWMMLQRNNRRLCDCWAAILGQGLSLGAAALGIEIEFRGSGVDEVGIVVSVSVI